MNNGTKGWLSRDRIVVSTLRCGRNNPGSNPGHGRFWVVEGTQFIIDFDTNMTKIITFCLGKEVVEHIYKSW